MSKEREVKVARTTTCIIPGILVENFLIHHHCPPQVEYFSGSKAVDALVNDSPWCAEKAKVRVHPVSCLFTFISCLFVKEGAERTFDSRERAVEFMDLMLKHKMFHRARKIPVHSEKKKSK